MKLRFATGWLWGVRFDRRRRALSVFPLPCIGIVVEFPR